MSAEDFTMARRRQHAAHEVGHTLGLAHNFIAASYGRASVMDYPAPWITLRDGQVDLSDAYRPGPGAYDSIAIRYAYTRFEEGQEEAGLAAIVREATERRLKFVTNPDEGASGSYPEASTWVNGADMVEELARIMNVRRVLLREFDERAISPGDPMHLLNLRLTAVYLHHRFTLLAALKAVGGMEFRYAVRGDTAPATAIVSPARQRRALELLLDALEPAELAIPERILVQLAPRPFGYTTSDRAFGGVTGHAFDQLGAARTVAALVIGGAARSHAGIARRGAPRQESGSPVVRAGDRPCDRAHLGCPQAARACRAQARGATRGGGRADRARGCGGRVSRSAGGCRVGPQTGRGDAPNPRGRAARSAGS